MHTLTFCSFKGGTAKTSTALNLATCIAKLHGKRVLLIDYDSQANLSTGLGIGPGSLETMVPVLKGEKPIQDVIQQTNTENLFVIPGNAYLDGIERLPPLLSAICMLTKNLGRAWRQSKEVLASASLTHPRPSNG